MPTPIIKYFAYEHLPANLQEVSKPVGDLAHLLDALLPDGPEKTTGLRKLLEAKDCFVRQALDKPIEVPKKTITPIYEWVEHHASGDISVKVTNVAEKVFATGSSHLDAKLKIDKQLEEMGYEIVKQDPPL
ncbi:hypothetical protein NCZ17_01395 [Acinetobacter modestus]|uniref:hypothetical protein n=1 Tax=Acinetobacter modestus TaxID=1776740 RepID=UPI00202DC117|nr:hypothetical protein [Acinetobacter modestus]MCM1958027.1 hypothetical protein [Acinetobacter modestus]